MGVGYTFGPNGMQTVITVDPPKPSSFDYGFETGDAISVNVHIETESEPRAETIRKDLEDKMGWKPAPLTEVPTVGSAFGEAFLAGFFAPIAVGLVMLFGGFVWSLYGLATPHYFQPPEGSYLDASNIFLMFTLRVVVATAPIAFVVALLMGLAKVKRR